ncbi:LuxR family two component transcriptional regulator [Actinomadura pelletieri DSM 43383]|uniref:LuxR family two component transcriptional regulator n=1 Tax=Actinomadura pelletieri DSM 43383 TaxID=1120940 RepID=A0A495R001_9ACTN|nr:LuxR family two component transcriptional regulator [Actinomadura pelletieri DSM 43383]
MFRAGVRAALETGTDLTVVGETGTAAEGVSLARELRPDVVLMDLHLPDGSGIEATRELLDGAEPPPPRILVLTMSEEDDSVVAALRAGARGYVVKGVLRGELVQAVQTVAVGGAVFSPAVADRLGAYFTALHTAPSRAAFPDLTAREAEILDLVARGLDNRQIARRLVLSDKTVRNYVSQLLTKLQVHDRTQAAVRARDAGLGT